MKKHNIVLQDGFFTAVTLLGAFCANLMLQSAFQTYTMTPMIFVLGVFLVSWRTQGYLWGIGGTLIYLAIAKQMEPTLLLPMGFSATLGGNCTPIGASAIIPAYILIWILFGV